MPVESLFRLTLENYVVSNVPVPMVLVLRRGAKQSELCSLLLLLAHLIQKRRGQQRRAGLSGKGRNFKGTRFLKEREVDGEEQEREENNGEKTKERETLIKRVSGLYAREYLAD